MFKLLIMLIIVLYSNYSYSCSCKGYELDEEFRNNNVVVIGTVKNFSKPPLWERLFYSGYPMRKAIIDVSKSFKSPKQETISVYTDFGAAACGFPFEEGVEYAIFAKTAGNGDLEGKLLVHSCNPTIHTVSRDDPHEPERKRVVKFLSNK